MNNYEKIKNMSIDEMAEFMSFESCHNCPAMSDNHVSCGLSVDYCKRQIKQWLESEER